MFLFPFYYLFCHCFWRHSLILFCLCQYWSPFFTQCAPFNISCRTGLMVMNSFTFYSENSLSLSILNDSLARQSFLAAFFFSFSTLNISCHSLLAFQISVECYTASLIGLPLYVKDFCCLIDFKIFFLITLFCYFQ